MTALARLAVRRPKLVLAIWGAAMGIFALIGLGVEDNLKRTSLVVAGSESAHARDLGQQRFGEGFDTYVLLTGPRRELDRQVPELVKALKGPKESVLSAYSDGASRDLRPAPDKTLLVVRSRRPFDEVSREVVPQLRRTITSTLRRPVKYNLTGFGDIANGLHGSTVNATQRAEKLTAPVLLLVLLLVFRSPIAAGLPLVIGFTTIGAAGGVLEVLNSFHPLDVVAFSLTTMMGLALGVDYALLLVSRFREELAGGREPREAALLAVTLGGRTIVFAGIALFAAMLASLLVVPADLMASASFGVLVATAMSVLAALTGLPAMLALLGPNVNRFSFGGAAAGTLFAGLALRALRRPGLAAGIVLVVMLGLAGPALGIETGPPDTGVLPKDRVERADYEAFKHELGEGWAAPYEIVLATRGRPITEKRRLAAIDRFQRNLAVRRDVRAVIGPGEIAERTRPLDRVPGQLERAGAQLKSGNRSLGRLRSGLQQAGSGVEQLGNGLTAAAQGAELLRAGGGRTAEGAAQLRAGLGAARDGSLQLSGGLGRAATGARALRAGTSSARGGIDRLRSGLAAANRGVRRSGPGIRRLANGLDEGAAGLDALREPAQLADSELDTALDALRKMLVTSKADPQYRRLFESVARAKGAVSGRNPIDGESVRRGYSGLDAELKGAAERLAKTASDTRAAARGFRSLSAGLGRLERGAADLGSGLTRLERGNAALLSGISRLERGSRSLSGGLGALPSGGDRIVGATRRLQEGAGRLQQGLAAGGGETGGLRGGIGQLERGVQNAQERGKRLDRSFGDPGRLKGIFGSGYFVLAAVDGSSADVRNTASFGVNLDRGGSAARIVVVGEGKTTKAGHPLRKVLERDLGPLERTAGVTARLGGAGPAIQDFDAAASDRLVLLVAMLCAVTYVVLLVALRSLLLPLFAVLLNVLTVGAAFGALVVLFQGDPILGGPGFLDAFMVFGIFGVTFGLAIDYEMFLLSRMREGYLRSGDTDAAVEYGLRRTAGVITGGALIMTAVFVAFALTDLTTARQLGVGLTIAVLLDATLVRLVLLPGLIRLCGDASWKLPAAIDRLLPASREQELIERTTAPN